VENLEIKQNNRFDFHPAPLEGLWVVQRKPIADERGFFSRFFCGEEFETAGLKKPIAQMNHTYTVKRGTVRGLHFQYPPHAECKIVSCLRGEVYDVAVCQAHLQGSRLATLGCRAIALPRRQSVRSKC
jgi:dTDP-4-dehydrorhamnose 3,5-epimerase-like enzyme